MGVRPCLVVLALVVVNPASALASSTYNHPGTIVDAVEGNKIVAHAAAYASDIMTSQGDCPIFDDLVDDAWSQAESGEFAFKIDPANPHYTAVYCEVGYWPRVDHGIGNDRDAKVQPDPVLLMPDRQTLLDRGIDPIQAVQQAIHRVIDSAATYLSQVKEELFASALVRFSADEQSAILVLRKMKARPSQAKPADEGNPPTAADPTLRRVAAMAWPHLFSHPPLDGPPLSNNFAASAGAQPSQETPQDETSSRDAYPGIRNIVSGAESSLAYFWLADKESFSKASEAFPGDVQNAIGVLRDAGVPKPPAPPANVKAVGH